MVCIYCGSETQVINSRPQKRVNQIWRRRKCQQCSNIMTSHEVFDLSASVLVEYNNKTLQPFHRDLLFVSIYESCKHRPNTLVEVSSLTQTIVAELLQGRLRDSKVTRSAIIETAAKVLQRFDASAAAIYQAYHR